MREYFLHSDRLHFSTWGEGDGALAHRLWGDPQVSRYICAAGVFTPEEIEARLALERDNQTRYGLSYWPVFTEGEEFVGCCGLRPHGEGCLEVGIHLLPQFWRQGYGREAMTAVMGYAFDVLGVQTLFAGHNPRNTPSAGLIRSLGFVYQGEEFYPPTGLYHPSYELKRPQ